MSFNALLSPLLEHAASSLDISAQQQELAIARYQDLGEWLVENHRGLADIDVYAQGSFRVGTVVRPTGPGGDFDIDLVFLRDLAKESITQDELKQTAGQLLRSYCTARDFGEPVELGRCWRLEFFEDGFHLDVLPVIPDPDHDGILLSDRDLRHWLASNPIGYADWFYDRMNKTLFEQRLVALAEALGRSVEDVPRFLVRTPLQRVVQLLKRSRDHYFADNPIVQPTSILITTLVGRAYRGQEDLDRALIETARLMPGHIEQRSGQWWVENPAHPAENFADKWNAYPERREAFVAWLKSVAEAADSAARSTTLERAGDELSSSLGPSIADAARTLKGAPPVFGYKATRGESRAPHEEFIEERFPVSFVHEVTISSEVAEPNQSNRYLRRRAARSRRLAKERPLKFEITSTTVSEPYEVYWKIRNFGREALLKGQLRGQLHRDEGQHRRYEHTRYRGEHYVDCYIVKDGTCVARTREWVPIE